MIAADSDVIADKAIAKFLERRQLVPDTEEYIEAREQARRWLDQFESDERPYMLEVMNAMRVETTADINRAVGKLAKSIIKALGNRHAEAAFFGIDQSPASSGNHFLYLLLQALGLQPVHAKGQERIPELVARGIPLVFIDDIVGSGNQAIRYSKSVFDSPSQNAIYGCLYGLDSGIRRIEEAGHFGKVLSATRLTEKDGAFTSGSRLNVDEASREIIKSIAKRYGDRIYPVGPLGYEGAGLLIAFPHNTPNNTLPIIWGGVESESMADDWEPLIPRRKAPKSANASAIAETGGRQSMEVRLPAKPEFYEHLHPFDPVRIENVFVEPQYEIYVNTIDGIQTGIPQGFVSDAALFLGRRDGILLLSSPYGCGKTVLSKYLDIKGVLGASDKVAYVSASSLKHILSKTKDFSALFRDVPACIVDTVDELVIDDNDAEQNLTLLCRCLTAARRSGTKVIVNLRVSDANHVENRVVSAIFENLYAEADDLRLPVIRLRGFEKKQIVEWLAKYQAGMQAPLLTFGRIEELHKRLSRAAGNPLFLYQLASYHQSSGALESIYAVYQIYDTFVESTTTGRFELPGGPSRLRLWRLAPQYSAFLEHVACAINNSRSFRTNSRLENDSESDWRLDANDLTHSISDRDLSKALRGVSLQFLAPDGGDARQRRDNRLELLNNYFFIRNRELIGFKDNNILFFLIARRLFRAISGLAADDSERLDADLDSIAETKGHPQAIEILLKRIQAEGDAFRAALSRRLDSLIKENRIIQLTSESLDKLTGDTINRDIILSIILLHVRRGSYDQLGYFLTRLSWLTSAVKVQDSTYRTLIARFFRGIQLKDVEFRRLNCDDFNFEGTTFEKVKFIQCKLFSAIFDDTTHTATQFALCDFGGHKEVAEFSRVTGSMSFDYCHVGRLMIVQDNHEASISLERCEIDELHIESKNPVEGAKIDLRITGSKVGKIFFVNVYLGDCEFQQSHIGQISDKNSKGHIQYSFSRSASEIQWGKRTGNIHLLQSGN